MPTGTEVSMMKNKEFYAAVEKMAEDNDYFLQTFIDAFDKLIHVGYQPEELQKCSASHCTFEYSQNEKWVSLKFACFPQDSFLASLCSPIRIQIWVAISIVILRNRSM